MQVALDMTPAKEEKAPLCYESECVYWKEAFDMSWERTIPGRCKKRRYAGRRPSFPCDEKVVLRV